MFAFAKTIWNFTRIAGLFLLIGYLNLVHLSAADYFVATNGSDANAGTIGAPFLTLTQAQVAVRAALPTATEPVNVWVRGGAYFVRHYKMALYTTNAFTAMEEPSFLMPLIVWLPLASPLIPKRVCSG